MIIILAIIFALGCPVAYWLGSQIGERELARRSRGGGYWINGKTLPADATVEQIVDALSREEIEEMKHLIWLERGE